MQIDSSKVNFLVDPMTEHKMQMQMQSNPKFAQVINMNISDKIYAYIAYKVNMRENLNLAIKGETRSGKSTVGISLGGYISGLTQVPYNMHHICANESECFVPVKARTRNTTRKLSLPSLTSSTTLMSRRKLCMH